MRDVNLQQLPFHFLVIALLIELHLQALNHLVLVKEFLLELQSLLSLLPILLFLLSFIGDVIVPIDDIAM